MKSNNKNSLALKMNEVLETSGRGYSNISFRKRANRCESVPSCLKNPKDTAGSMKIYPEGHIENNWNITYEQVIQRLDANKDSYLPENRDLIKSFIQDARIGKTIIGRQKKKVGLKRIAKYLQDLKKLDSYFKKPLNQVSEEDIEHFVLDLEEGRINNNGKPYAPETQIVIKKLIKKFYKWLEGDNIDIPRKVRWIDTSLEIKEYSAIKKEKVYQMLTLMTSTKGELLVRNKALIMFLFDSGVRADELLNIRIKHLEYENDNYRVRIEFSKTKKRTISLPFCKQYLNDWLDIHPLRNEPLAQLFPMNYNQLRMIVQRAGTTIKHKLTPHSLRHSSATYWCQHLTPYELCYRFGWSMSSRMPQRYIDREGLYQEKASKIVKAGQIEDLQAQNSFLNRRLASMEDQLNQLFGEDIDEAKRILKIVKEQLKIKNEIGGKLQ